MTTLNLFNLVMLIIFLPLASSLMIGFFSLAYNQIKNIYVDIISVLSVGISCIISLYVFYGFYIEKYETIESLLYTWGVSGGIKLEVGILVDKLSSLMAMIVTFVSCMVHIYTIGYMDKDIGYKRFFSYISFFTFAMLILVMSNNFLQLFFGWEAVGLTSYLLIGFWFHKETAIFANLKAFIVNRVGDLGFIIGISAILFQFGTLNYTDIFSVMIKNNNINPGTFYIFGHECYVITFICLCLFVGGMGKSAQIPLHVWLPDSMEGPTPISALIHAATMVTAGIFMCVRMSPLFEFSQTALIVILIIGTLTCVMMGMIGIVQNDIKRIIAYSTLSQLGLMMSAIGVSAYSAAIFHLMTHAFFKALLFLGAGSVITGMHHEQNIKKMGGVGKYMPITYTTMLFATLALIGFPGFSGFFSKDLILECIKASKLFGANYLYYLVLSSVFITSLYSFRMFFLVFHNNYSKIKIYNNLKESSIFIIFPLIILTIPSIMSGWLFIDYILQDYFAKSIFILPEHHVVAVIQNNYHGPMNFVIHGMCSIISILSLSGFLLSYIIYIFKPKLSSYFKLKLRYIYLILINKYWFDMLNELIISAFIRRTSLFFWIIIDTYIIDGFFVNGSTKVIYFVSNFLKKLQNGYLYTYVSFMII